MKESQSLRNCDASKKLHLDCSLAEGVLAALDSKFALFLVLAFVCHERCR